MLILDKYAKEKVTVQSPKRNPKLCSAFSVLEIPQNRMLLRSGPLPWYMQTTLN
jgi:hypothetical protein